MRQSMASSGCGTVYLAKRICWWRVRTIVEAWIGCIMITQFNVVGGKFYVLTLNNPSNLCSCRAARFRGVEQGIESCSVGLYLTRDEPNGGIQNLSVGRGEGCLY